MTGLRDFYPVLDTSSEKGRSNIKKARRHIGKAPDVAFFVNELEKPHLRLPFGGAGKNQAVAVYSLD